MTPGHNVRTNLTNALTTLNGSPTTAAEWQSIARELRRAADSARTISRLAGRMNEAPAPSSPDGRYLGL